MPAALYDLIAVGVGTRMENLGIFTYRFYLAGV